jgi:hypothetical protein
MLVLAAPVVAETPLSPGQLAQPAIPFQQPYFKGQLLRPPATAFGSITMIRTGWNIDGFVVVTGEPIINPASCSAPDGYMSHNSFPGYSTYYAAALTAYLAHRPVTIIVDGNECFGDRPKLIGIDLRN